MLQCRWATEGVSNGGPGSRPRYPQICSFRGQEPLVCCPTSSESILFPNTGFLTSRPKPPRPASGLRPPVPRPPRPPPPVGSGPGSVARQKCLEYEKFVLPERYGPDQECVDNHSYPIGGNPSLAKEFPHMALLGYGKKPSISYGCGGSVISMLWVMTAAHCVINGESPVDWVLVGDLVISVSTDDANPQLIPVAQRVMHPDFKPPQGYNDIGLLRLQWSPNMNTGHVRPACLHVDRELAKEKLYLTGWGHTEYLGESADALMEVAIYRTKYDECVKSFGSNAEVFMPRGVDNDTQICAGAGHLGKDACNGDSGGPLQTPIIKPSCMYKVVGIVSLGQGCGLGAPGIYTRVSTFVPWIENIVWPDP